MYKKHLTLKCESCGVLINMLKKNHLFKTKCSRCNRIRCISCYSLKRFDSLLMDESICTHCLDYTIRQHLGVLRLRIRYLREPYDSSWKDIEMDNTTKETYDHLRASYALLKRKREDYSGDTISFDNNYYGIDEKDSLPSDEI